MKASAELVLRELGDTLRDLDEAQCETLLAELTRPGRRVLLMGVGRVEISLKAWVKRLVHLGIDINYVGSESEQPVGPEDLVLVASSSGESALPLAIAGIARRIGATIGYIGCSPASSVAALSDFQVLLRGRTKLAQAHEYPSKQPMSTLFEQQLYLLGDILTLEMMARNGWTEADVKQHHANLE